MAANILNKEQLQQLMQFIYSRGFREPFVAMEILDHFACKVEEKLEQNPSLALQEAMKNAHKDFGVLGFNPIVNAYLAAIEKKYKKIYAAEKKKLLVSLPYIMLFVTIGILFFKGFCWAEINNYKHLMGINDILAISYVLFIISIISLKAISSKALRMNPVKGVILGLDTWALCGTSFIFSQMAGTLLDGPHRIASPTGITIVGLCFAFIFTYLCLRQIALTKTLKIASGEIREVSANFNGLMAGV